MKQEVKVTVELILSLPVEKSKEEIKKGVETGMDYLRLNLNNVLVSEFSKYKNGDIITEQSASAKVIDIEEESEIYETHS